MRIDVLTIFPEILVSPLKHSILKRAQEKGLVEVKVINIRDFAYDKHRVTDDYPYGGGHGMVMKPEPIFRAVASLLDVEEDDIPGHRNLPSGVEIILLSPQGEPFTQEKAWDLARAARHLILICGRYEGVDERVRKHLATEEISIGDYVLSGGEVPALVVVDAVVRLLPGALGDGESPRHDSFSDGLLEGPQFTRPREYLGLKVPEVLLTGDHERIRRWRRKEALKRTLERRPELLEKVSLSGEDLRYLQEIEDEA